MKAIFLEGPQTLAVKETETPDIGATDVLIRVKNMGICGSDIEYFTHNKCGSFVPKNPLVLGHELAGVVEQIGAGVTSIAVGTRVAVDPSMPCRVCLYCRSGRHNLCDNMRFIGTAATYPHISGGLGEYVAMPEGNCYTVPEDVSWENAACLEPLSVAVHAALRPGSIAGKRVLVTGGGTIGQFVALVCRAFGAAVVGVSDIQGFRRDFAVARGADYGIDPTNSNELSSIIDATGGFDTIFEASGAAPAVVQNLDLINKGGTIVQIGTIGQSVEMPANIIMSKELTVLGSFRYGDIYPISMSLLATKRVDVTPLVTEVFAFEKAVQAFELAAARGNAIKIQVRVGE